MKYKGLLVKIISDKNLSREDKNDEIVICDVFTIEVVSGKSKKLEIDVFSAAVNFELLKNSFEEAVQFAKDYIDSEEKEYLRLIKEYMLKNE